MGKANQDIRRAIKEAGLYQWQVAEYIGVHDTTFTRWLRVELEGKEKEDILSAIKSLEDKKGKA